MVTKTELLSKLTSDQLKEIAIAENVQIPDEATKDGIIRGLLKLSMRSIRAHVAEYTQEPARTTIDHEDRAYTLPTRIIEQIPPKILGVDVGKRIADMTEEIETLVKEKLKAAKLEETGERLSQAIDKLETSHPRKRKAQRPARKSEARKRRRPRRKRARQEPKPTVIETVEALPDRISTGYEDLDNLLFGGIPKNYAVILTSASCDEKELLVKRFLEAGAREGQITFHVTIEASDVKTLAEEFQSNFYLFICNPQANSIIKTLPNVFKLKGVDNLTEINIALTSAFRKLDASLKGPRRACIEIISDILLQHHAASIRKWLAALIPELKSRGFTILAVMNPHMHTSEEVQAILDLFEGEISIYEKQTSKGMREKYLRISKLYNQRYLDNELTLKRERLST
jgi:KaiC/GvpD/RAD55 family RecA-like ATPase